MPPTDEQKPPWVVETSTETFEQDVNQRSQSVPVLVDFWNAFCRPCQILAPILSDLADEYAGRFVLVKANTDDVPEWAARFPLRGVPTVFAVINAEVVDVFEGVPAIEQIRSWIDRILVLSAIKQAEECESSDPTEAEQIYRELIATYPDNAKAVIGLARLLVAQQQYDESRTLIQSLERRGFLEPEAEKVKASLDLIAMGSSDLAKARDATAADPHDPELKIKLAEALAGQEEYEESLQLCLELVAQDRHGAGEDARQIMIGIFRVLPGDSPLTQIYRRKLATLLY